MNSNAAKIQAAKKNPKINVKDYEFTADEIKYLMRITEINDLQKAMDKYLEYVDPERTIAQHMALIKKRAIMTTFQVTKSKQNERANFN